MLQETGGCTKDCQKFAFHRRLNEAFDAEVDAHRDGS